MVRAVRMDGATKQHPQVDIAPEAIALSKHHHWGRHYDNPCAQWAADAGVSMRVSSCRLHLWEPGKGQSLTARRWLRRAPAAQGRQHPAHTGAALPSALSCGGPLRTLHTACSSGKASTVVAASSLASGFAPHPSGRADNAQNALRLARLASSLPARQTGRKISVER